MSTTTQHPKVDPTPEPEVVQLTPEHLNQRLKIPKLQMISILSFNKVLTNTLK